VPHEPGEPAGEDELTASPTRVPGAVEAFAAAAGTVEVVAIEAGQQHSMALLSNGTVMTWGWDELGQLGDDHSFRDQSSPVPVAGLLDVVAISSGGRHSLALLRDGSVRAWGQGDGGQLGDGSREDRPLPVRVDGLRGVGAVDAGGGFSLAIRRDDSGSAVAITKGDWVEVNAEDGCADPSEFPPSRPAGPGARLPCIENGTVLMVVGGPDQVEGQRFWALSGFGWFNERYLTFHHEGRPPYPTDLQRVDDRLIAYVGPDRGLWVMGSDGSDARRLNRGPVVGTPVWSPDGRLLAFTGDDRLRIVTSAGAMLVDLPGYRLSEARAWSPDSTMVTASRAAGGRAFDDLAVVAVSGEVVLQLASAEEPSWSADSSRIAFFEIDADYPEELNPSGIIPAARGVVVNVQAGDVTGLSQDADLQQYHAGPPLWRPHHPDEFAYGAQLRNTSGVEVASLPSPVVTWSPDGRHAVLVGQGEGDGIAANYILYDMEARSQVALLTVPACQCDAPAWAAFAFSADGQFSTDGRYFHYTEAVSRGGGSGMERLVDLETGIVTNPPFPGWAGSVSGSTLLWATRTVVYPEFRPRGVSDWIWTSDIDGREIVVLAEGSDPRWQPSASGLATAHTPLQAAGTLADYYGRDFRGECGSAGHGLCASALGRSGAEYVFALEDPASGETLTLVFVRAEGDGYVVGHLEPAFCQGQAPCPPPTGATVEVAVSETCATARLEPGRAGRINRCLGAGERGTVAGPLVERDARLWIELAGIGWVSASYLRCVEGCG
ncbi:MAG: hypothetical protein GEU28_06245, partial [Dehalococcoidia bacterium]|nr:hypothetical protein [Dehalococcoidia bacterium]